VCTSITKISSPEQGIPVLTGYPDIAVIGRCSIITMLVEIRVQSATGVSFLPGSCSGLFAVPWLVYGMVHQEKPIMLRILMDPESIPDNCGHFFVWLKGLCHTFFFEEVKR